MLMTKEINMYQKKTQTHSNTLSECIAGPFFFGKSFNSLVALMAADGGCANISLWPSAQLHLAAGHQSG